LSKTVIAKDEDLPFPPRDTQRNEKKGKAYQDIRKYTLTSRFAQQHNFICVLCNTTYAQFGDINNKSTIYCYEKAMQCSQEVLGVT
jgi:hypothetical protein